MKWNILLGLFDKWPYRVSNKISCKLKKYLGLYSCL